MTMYRWAAVAIIATIAAGCGGNDHAGEGAEAPPALVPPADVDPGTAAAPVSGDLHPAIAPVPPAPMGRTLRRSALENAPGYVPLDDPELASVERGRREVDRIDGFELVNAYPSPDALAKRILTALEENDVDTLVQDLRMTREEFETLCWPEFPESRPATNIPVEESWGFLARECLAGATRGMHAFGGMKLELDRITYTVGLHRYTNFNLLSGMVVHAHGPDGAAVEVDFVRTMIERNGRFKVFVYGE